MSTPRAEQHSFAAEVDQVLSIVVNSLYSHREVFLRELISNASDALDKLAFRALTEPGLLGDDKELRIEIEHDAERGTLTIRDNGIGMAREEVIENLGTIARSGSRQMMAEAARSADREAGLSLIGQFGVGFYSAFLVADRVTVVTRAAGGTEAWRWESDARTGYTIEPAERPGRGTDVVLHLKEDAAEFRDEWRLRALVRKYSDYVRHPIRMLVEKPAPAGEDEGGTEKRREWETINQASALWTRPKSEITDEQYREFYKHLAHDWEDPLAWTHFKVEGTQELRGLLFLPGHAPFDLFERRNHGVRLFVKRVFIMEDCEELLPEWLRFVRGVVDSEDLPLNVSRELLQQDRVTRQIRKQVTKRVLALLEELAEESGKRPEAGEGEVEANRESDRYARFWREFGRVLKEGLHLEPDYREQIARLLRYPSSNGEEFTALHDYVARMAPDQPGIYYITGDSLEACRSSPHLEGLRQRGYEILYMADPIDEWVVQALPQFEDKPLIAAAKGALDLPESEADKAAKAAKQAEMAGLIGAVRTALGERVKDVRLTNRLTDSPACLVTEESDLSPHVARLLRAQGREVPEPQRVLELNPGHPIVAALEGLAADEGRKAEVEEWSSLLFDSALLAEGTLPKDPAALARRISDLLQKVVGRR